MVIFLCRGKRLKDFKLQFGHENNFGSKITQLGLFDFRAFLNIGILPAQLRKSFPALEEKKPNHIGQKAIPISRFVNPRYFTISLTLTRLRLRLTIIIRPRLPYNLSTLFSRISGNFFQSDKQQTVCLCFLNISSTQDYTGEPCCPGES